MKIFETPLADACIIEPRIHKDPRGYFLESFQAERFESVGLPHSFTQDNVSFSRKGVLRGLHFQNPNAQGKLIWVLQGLVFDVAVDLRRHSKSFGMWHGVELSSENHRQFYVPEGFAHGFMVVSETALFAYKCTKSYSPQDEKCLAWNDPDIGIRWPEGLEAQLSEKDSQGSRFKDFGPGDLF